jgi:hypothetical protein
VFKAALKTLKQDYGFEQKEILHVAQVPALALKSMMNIQLVAVSYASPACTAENMFMCYALGFKTAWIERRHGQQVPATVP